MANQFQQLIYEGYLGGDPEMRFTDTGLQVTNFSIASTRKYKEVPETTWMRVTAWNNLAEIVNKYCEKGSHVIVVGRLLPGEDGAPKVFPLKTGKYVSSYEVIADSVRIIKGKARAGGDGSVEPQMDDVPF